MRSAANFAFLAWAGSIIIGVFPCALILSFAGGHNSHIGEGASILLLFFIAAMIVGAIMLIPAFVSFLCFWFFSHIVEANFLRSNCRLLGLGTGVLASIGAILFSFYFRPTFFVSLGTSTIVTLVGLISLLFLAGAIFSLFLAREGVKG